jgi:hypothetical protein
VAVPRFLTDVIEEDQIPVSRKIWADTIYSITEDLPVAENSWYNVITANRCSLITR